MDEIRNFLLSQTVGSPTNPNGLRSRGAQFGITFATNGNRLGKNLVGRDMISLINLSEIMYTSVSSCPIIGRTETRCPFELLFSVVNEVI